MTSPNIFIPTKEILLPMEAKVGYAGFIKWTLYDSNGRVKRQAGPYRNLIVDAGMNAANGTAIGDGSPSLTDYCAVGTGTAAPANGDTSLQSQTGSRSTQVSTPTTSGAQTSSTPYYGWFKKTYTFGPGVAPGNLTELGFFTASSGGTMWARQLFLDGGGSPTTVVVASDETLTVEYEVRRYAPDATDVVQNINISGTDYVITIRPFDMDADVTGNWTKALAPFPSSITTTSARIYPGASALGSVTAGVTGGTATNSSSSTRGSYSNGTFTNTITSVWNPNVGTGNVQYGSFCGGPSGYLFKWGLDAAMNKTADKRLTMQFSVTWARYTP